MFGIKKKRRSESDSLSLLNTDQTEAQDHFAESERANSSRFNKLTQQKKLLLMALIAVFALGALGAGIRLPGSNSSVLSKLAESVGLKEKAANSSGSLFLPDPSLQLSKEYVYAGSRMLAIEDYGIASTTTPAPTATPTATPTSTPTATPTATPTTVNGNSAVFVQADTTTQGSWAGIYGAQGYKLAGDSTSLPTWAQVSFTGQSDYTWASTTTDARALTKASNSSDRIAATWYTFTSYDISFNFTDSQSHKIALYSLDWDTSNTRSQTLEALDGATNAVLDTRTLNSFNGGAYLVWQVSGNVKIRVTNLGPNAVVSGIFIDAGSSQSTPTPTPTPTPSSSYNAVTNFSASSNPSGAWSYGQKASISSTFAAFTYHGQQWTGIDNWSMVSGGQCCGMVAKNSTTSTQTYVGQVTQPVDLLNLHPGPSGELATVRWTAPAAGTYQVQGRFEGLDTTGTTSDVHILHNGTGVWSDNISGFGDQATYSFTLSVAAGDVVEFAVGPGASYSPDSTGLEAIITLVP